MNVFPITVKPEEICIQADRQLAFEVITAFRSATSNPVKSVTILQRDDEQDHLLAEFRTSIPLPFGLTWRTTTREWVTFLEPEEIRFELASSDTSGLAMLKDRFLLEQSSDGTTRLRYESTFGLNGWVLGWLLGRTLIYWINKRHMRTHLKSLKETIEVRAKASRRFSSSTNQNGHRE